MSALREKLLAFADAPHMTAYERAHARAIVLAAARIALAEAARECEDRDCGILECCVAERSKAIQQCAAAIRAIAASLVDAVSTTIKERK